MRRQWHQPLQTLAKVGIILAERAKEAAELQSACPQFLELLDVKESIFI